MKAAAPGRTAAWIIVGLCVALLAYELWDTARLLPLLPNLIGHDFTTYMDATRNWLADGTFYPARELAGPFQVVEREILYPPVALWLLVPFTVLPAVLWWIVPLVVTGAVVVAHRPSPWAWAGIAVLCVVPITSFSYSATLDMIWNGNPVMWVVALIALATRFPFFGPFALFKPTPLLSPFALIGVRSRQWWLGAGVFALACLAFLPMWPDYVRVLLNARGGGLVYGPSSVFPALIPVIAWIGSSLGAAQDEVRANDPGARLVGVVRARWRRAGRVGLDQQGARSVAGRHDLENIPR